METFAAGCVYNNLNFVISLWSNYRRKSYELADGQRILLNFVDYRNDVRLGLCSHSFNFWICSNNICFVINKKICILRYNLFFSFYLNASISIYRSIYLLKNANTRTRHNHRNVDNLCFKDPIDLLIQNLYLSQV